MVRLVLYFGQAGYTRGMPYLVGTDEAGYGPNLGPLTISATVWRVPETFRWQRGQSPDLYARLADTICSAPDGERIAIADSKQLYKPGNGLAHLERGFLAALAATDRRPGEWGQIWSALEADPDEHVPRQPWHAGYRCELPVAIDCDDLLQASAKLASGLGAARMQLVAIRSRAIFPHQFNGLIEKHGTKGAALSHLTLALLGEVLPLLEPEPVLVVCDKHGGRNYYQPLLQRQFPEHLVEVRREGGEESIYRWGPSSTRVEVRFRVRAEEFVPSALASMACKYLRELAMLAFNDFWCCRVPNLRPTAGYPLDARRFRKEIAAAQQTLGIDDRTLWRER